MFRSLVNWWYSTPAAPASSALAAPSVAHPKQHPATSSSSGIVTALVSGAMNAAMSRPAVTDGSDELGTFQKSINEEIAKLEAKLADWRQRKIELLGQQENIPQSAVVLGRVEINTFSDLLRLIKDDLGEMVMTPSAEIRTLLQRARPYLDAQQQHVNDLVQQLHATSDEQQQKKIKVQICDINISLLQEFIHIIYDISTKIQSELTAIVLGEKVALSILSTTLLLMAQIAFPQMDAEVEEGLRDYMGRSIRSEGSELDGVLTQLEGEIAQAWLHVASNQVHNTDAVNSTASSADAGVSPADAASVVPPASSSATGLFAAAASNVHTALRTSVDNSLVPSAPALK
jgi:hypothetical protein